MRNMTKRRMMLQSYSTKKSPIPEEYQEVSWLKGSGTQYCKTDYYAAHGDGNNTVIKGDLIVNTNSSYFALGAKWQPAGNLAYGIEASYRSFTFYYGIENTYKTTVSLSSSEEYPIHYELGSDYLRLNDLTYPKNSIDFSMVDPYHAILIGAFQQGSGTSVQILNNETCVKKFSIYNGNVLRADIIPCYRKSDGKAGFYQLDYLGASSFITNQGTGEDWIIGPDV